MRILEWSITVSRKCSNSSAPAVARIDTGGYSLFEEVGVGVEAAHQPTRLVAAGVVRMDVDIEQARHDDEVSYIDDALGVRRAMSVSTRAMRPSSTPTSATPLMSLTGSITWPPLSSISSLRGMAFSFRNVMAKIKK